MCVRAADDECESGLDVAINFLPIINFSDNFLCCGNCITGSLALASSRIADVGGSRIAELSTKRAEQPVASRHDDDERKSVVRRPTKNAHKFTPLTTAWSSLPIVLSPYCPAVFSIVEQMVPP